MRFDGSDYNPSRDDARLSAQHLVIQGYMKDGKWRTLRQIADWTGAPEPSVSAQLRHLRKPRFGSHTVDKRHIGNGLYEYRLLINEELKAA